MCTIADDCCCCCCCWKNKTCWLTMGCASFTLQLFDQPHCKICEEKLHFTASIWPSTTGHTTKQTHMIYLAAHTQQASGSVQELRILYFYAIRAIFKGDALAAHTAGGSVQELRINNFPALWASLKAQRAVYYRTSTVTWRCFELNRSSWHPKIVPLMLDLLRCRLQLLNPRLLRAKWAPTKIVIRTLSDRFCEGGFRATSGTQSWWADVVNDYGC